MGTLAAFAMKRQATLRAQTVTAAIRLTDQMSTDLPMKTNDIALASVANM